MKRILYSICVGSLALALTAQAQQGNDANGHRSAHAQTTASQKGAPASRSSAQVRTRSNMSNARLTQGTRISAPTRGTMVNRNAIRSNRTRAFHEQNVSSRSQIGTRNNATLNRGRNVNVNRNVTVNRQRNLTANRARNLTLNQQRNLTVNRQRNLAFNRQSNARISFNQAVRLHGREFHDRGWWRSHFNTIVFVNGGWYFWDAGYWFPAWGYAPYSYYPYAGPIYGYNYEAPDRVTVDVQEQLQRDGYYAGPVDGVLGPMTRQAIAAFQSDHGLAITSAIDEPTLATLGIS